MRPKTNPVERFWKKVRVLGPESCWEWIGAKEHWGHGRFRAGDGSRQYAHRYSFELANGPVANDLCVCHKCDNPSCVNPAHLFLGKRKPAAKLSCIQVKEIRELLAAGKTQKSIAVLYGISQAHVSHINTGVSWPSNEQEDVTMKTFQNQAAQGDMLITRVESLPEGLTEAEAVHGEHVIAHSETGHNHVISEDGVSVFEAANDPFVLYLKVDNTTELRHLRSFDTHESLKIAPGLYRVNRQREYTPEGFRRAAD